MNPTPVTLYDTTLRDGSQGEGINFSVSDKLKILQKLDDFGVHYAEGGWPGSNDKDEEFFRQARSLKLNHAKLTAFGSTHRYDKAVEKDEQVKALVNAGTSVVTIFGKVSKFHVINILKVSPDRNLELIRDTILYLKKCGKEVIFDGEHTFDGLSEDSAYTLSCFRAAESAGASYLVMCDTNGGSTPEFVKSSVALVKRNFLTPIGIHTHDDCGLSVANAVAAIQRGATQVQGTVNGFGERTGNCNLLTTLAILQLKYNLPIVSEENLAKMKNLSYFVDEIANQKPNKRAPFVGDSAFAHKGGIHVNAVKKTSASYEHIEPKVVGNSQRILIGELSGRSNIELKAGEMGINGLLESEISEILKKVKEFEHGGYEFEAADASFELLIKRTIGLHVPRFKLHRYLVASENTGTTKTSKAFINVEILGNDVEQSATGAGPVDALTVALSKALVKFKPEIACLRLVDYKVRIVDSDNGTLAVTRVFVEFTDGNVSWSTVGVSDDIIEASWLAISDGVEYFLSK